MICPRCRKNKAVLDPYYGYLPCEDCQEQQRKLKRPSRQIEFIPDYIKVDRRAYSTDFLPPHRKGQLDKGWVNRYGKKKAKAKGFSDREIKNAKYVWNSEKYYKDE